MVNDQSINNTNIDDIKHQNNIDNKNTVFISISQAAKLLGLGKTEMYNMARKPGFPKYQEKKKILVHREMLLEFVKDEIKRKQKLN
jgi:excisionase family DNA binding protein